MELGMNPYCICGHSEEEHFALGCLLCGCCWFMSWDEYDDEHPWPPPDEDLGEVAAQET